MELFTYGFIIRALLAGSIVAIVAPTIGIFLVLRRYSLIADTLSHVSLAGIAIGLLLGIHPLITALISSICASIGIEKLRSYTKVYGDSALAIFLSGSLAVAIVLMGFAKGFTVNINSLLFGSIVTVQINDLILIFLFAIIAIAIISLFYKELIYITFDEEGAIVSGIPTKLINLVFIVACACMVALAIPIVGVLLISALAVIPVVSALQLHKSFIMTIVLAQGMALCSVIVGIYISFYLNTSSGGTVVLVALGILCITIFTQRLLINQTNKAW